MKVQSIREEHSDVSILITVSATGQAVIRVIRVWAGNFNIAIGHILYYRSFVVIILIITQAPRIFMARQLNT